MNQKSSVVQILNSVPQVLASDSERPHCGQSVEALLGLQRPGTEANALAYALADLIADKFGEDI